MTFTLYSSTLANYGWLALGLTDPKTPFGNWGCLLRTDAIVVAVVPSGAGTLCVAFPVGLNVHAQAGWDMTGTLYLSNGFKIKL